MLETPVSESASNGLPLFYFKFRKLSYANEMMKKSTKVGIKKDYTPAVLNSLNNSGSLPISGCILKTQGEHKTIDMSNYSLGRNYGNALAENFQSPLYHTIKLKKNKFTQRTCQNMC